MTTKYTQLTAGEHDEYHVIGTFETTANNLEEHYQTFETDLEKHQPTTAQLQARLKELYPELDEKQIPWAEYYLTQQLKLRNYQAAHQHPLTEDTIILKAEVFLEYLKQQGLQPLEQEEYHMK